MLLNDPLSDLTIIIPTFNRNYFLSRLLCYLKEQGFDNIIVADSSSPEKFAVNQEIVNSLFGDNILHLWIREKEYLSNFYEKIHTAAENVRTPYVVWCRDKDFPIISGLRECVQYLNDNPDFQLADGKFYYFKLDYENRKISWKNHYVNKKTLDYEENNLRVNDYLRRGASFEFALIFTIHRTELFKKIYSEAIKYTDDVRFSERFVEILALIYGKYAYLDVDYWCKETNDSHSSSLIYHSLIDTLSDGSFSKKLERFKNGLYANLPLNNNIDMDYILGYFDYRIKYELELIGYREGKIKNEDRAYRINKSVFVEPTDNVKDAEEYILNNIHYNEYINNLSIIN